MKSLAFTIPSLFLFLVSCANPSTTLSDVSEGGIVSRSTNWSLAKVGGHSHPYDAKEMISSPDGTTLAVLIFSKLYLSNDSGGSFVPVSSLIFDELEADKIASVFFALRLGKLLISQDGGKVWQESSSPLKFQGLSCSGDGNHLVAFCTDDYYLYTSSDRGQNWTRQVSTYVPGGKWRGIQSSLDGSRLLAIKETGGAYEYYTSVNSGATWNKVTGGESDPSWNSGGRIFLAEDGNSLVYFGTTKALVSQNFGSSWSNLNTSGYSTGYANRDLTRLLYFKPNGEYVYSQDSGASFLSGLSPLALPVSVYFVPGTNKVFALYSSGYLNVSNDNGATWSETHSDLGERSWSCSSMSADGKLAVAGATNTSDLYVSSDFGQSWTEQGALGKKNWKFVSVSSDGLHVAALETKSAVLYTSSDAGKTWTSKLVTGTISAEYTWTSLSTSANGRGILLTSSANEFFSTIDGGSNWIPNTAYPYSPCTSGIVSSDGRWAMVLTNSNNILRFKLGEVALTRSVTLSTGFNYNIAGSDDLQRLYLSSPFLDDNGIGNYGSPIYSSWSLPSDYNGIGNIWDQEIAAGTRHWKGLSTTSDGSHVMAVADGGFVYSSEDYGFSWVYFPSLGASKWTSVALSKDGSHSIATDQYNRLWVYAQ